MADLLQQVQEIAKRPGNQVCAECPARHPAFVSLIKPVVVHETVGVFICEGCYQRHFRMGMHFCETKSLEVASDWSKRDVSILTKTGNDYANTFFEANLLDETSFENDKEIITFDEKEAEKLRAAFVKNKYMRRKYFCNAAYQKARDGRRSVQQQQNKEGGSRRASTGCMTDKKKQSVLERNCKECPSSKPTPSNGSGHNRAMGRRRASMAASTRRQQRTVMANLYEATDIDGDSDYSDSESGSDSSPLAGDPFQRPPGGFDRRPSGASAASNGSSFERRKQRHAHANAQAPSKLERFLTETAPSKPKTSMRRTCSVAGTADTPKPKAAEPVVFYGDRVAEGHVDSVDEVRRLKEAKRAKRASRRASRQTSNSSSRRTSSPSGVQEETRMAQSMQGSTRRKTVALTDTGRRPSMLSSGLQF